MNTLLRSVVAVTLLAGCSGPTGDNDVVTDSPAARDAADSSHDGTTGSDAFDAPAVDAPPDAFATDVFDATSPDVHDATSPDVHDATSPDVHDATAPDVQTLPAPPATWQEHWFEHDQLLHLVRSDDEVALYFDDDVPRTQVPWLFDLFQRVKHYTESTYGPLSPTHERLFGIFHQGRYGGGHPAYWFDPSHDNRNVGDCGLDSWNMGAEPLDVSTHEIGHIVESTVSGKRGSPAFNLWGDSKWMEFYQYDLYVGLGLTADAQRFHDQVIANVDTYPRAGTHWFRDWFFPLWRDHGHAHVMVVFYQLIGRYWPTDASGNVHDMNWGEYVHFTSGAAGVNLKPLATAAFGWPASYETQFNAARAAYPAVRAMYTYP